MSRRAVVTAMVAVAFGIGVWCALAQQNEILPGLHRPYPIASRR